eukprot:5938813-Prymnesium_polylepis.2
MLERREQLSRNAEAVQQGRSTNEVVQTSQAAQAQGHTRARRHGRGHVLSPLARPVHAPQHTPCTATNQIAAELQSPRLRLVLAASRTRIIYYL